MEKGFLRRYRNGNKGRRKMVINGKEDWKKKDSENVLKSYEKG